MGREVVVGFRTGQDWRPGCCLPEPFCYLSHSVYLLPWHQVDAMKTCLKTGGHLSSGIMDLKCRLFPTLLLADGKRRPELLEGWERS